MSWLADKLEVVDCCDCRVYTLLYTDISCGVLCVKVYFNELVRHAELDTLSAAQCAASPAHCNHITPTPSHHHSRTSTPPEAVVSPTDLSMRRDRSNPVDGTFTSPSSGFDSPSMHAGASGGTPAVDGTAGSGCSDNSAAAEADRSESYVVSPSPRAACLPADIDTEQVSVISLYVDSIYLSGVG